MFHYPEFMFVFITLAFLTALILLFISNEKNYSEDLKKKLQYSGYGLLSGGFLLIIGNTFFFSLRRR